MAREWLCGRMRRTILGKEIYEAQWGFEVLVW